MNTPNYPLHDSMFSLTSNYSTSSSPSPARTKKYSLLDERQHESGYWSASTYSSSVYSTDSDEYLTTAPASHLDSPSSSAYSDSIYSQDSVNGSSDDFQERISWWWSRSEEEPNPVPSFSTNSSANDALSRRRLPPPPAPAVATTFSTPAPKPKRKRSTESSSYPIPTKHSKLNPPPTTTFPFPPAAQALPPQKRPLSWLSPSSDSTSSTSHHPAPTKRRRRLLVFPSSSHSPSQQQQQHHAGGASEEEEELNPFKAIPFESTTPGPAPRTDVSSSVCKGVRFEDTVQGSEPMRGPVMLRSGEDEGLGQKGRGTAGLARGVLREIRGIGGWMG